MSYSFMSSFYFGTLGVHGLIYIAWSCGGVKAQKTYILLFWLGVLNMLSNMIIATGFGWDSGNILYNLSFARIFLEVLVSPLIFAVLNDMNSFMATKQNFQPTSKYLFVSSLVLLLVVIAFMLVVYFQVNFLAASSRLVLARMGSIVIYVPGKMLTSVYVWDIFWLVACLVFATALRVWITASWLMFALAGFLVSVVISPVVSFELSIYMVAYFKTCCIYFLLVLQQKIARRDINDRGYEVHQNQFNIIYRRVLHAGK